MICEENDINKNNEPQEILKNVRKYLKGIDCYISYNYAKKYYEKYLNLKKSTLSNPLDLIDIFEVYDEYSELLEKHFVFESVAIHKEEILPFMEKQLLFYSNMPSGLDCKDKNGYSTIIEDSYFYMCRFLYRTVSSCMHRDCDNSNAKEYAFCCEKYIKFIQDESKREIIKGYINYLYDAVNAWNEIDMFLSNKKDESNGDKLTIKKTISEEYDEIKEEVNDFFGNPDPLDFINICDELEYLVDRCKSDNNNSILLDVYYLAQKFLEHCIVIGYTSVEEELQSVFNNIESLLHLY